MERLAKGSKEFLIADITDRLGVLTTLAGTNPTYDIKIRDADTFISTGLPATVSGMKALCLVDTTLGAYVVDIYELFITFNNIPEQPRLGPFTFEVS